MTPRTQVTSYTLVPIGVVRLHDDAQPSRPSGDRPASDESQLGLASIDIFPEYRDGLLDLGHFSHVIVLWWASRRGGRADRATLRVNPRPAPSRTAGVFATRSPARPNPIAVSVCQLISLDEEEGLLRVDGLDAEHGTPVIDLKPYIPSNDRVRTATVPPWLPAWPDWACEEQ